MYPCGLIGVDDLSVTLESSMAFGTGIGGCLQDLKGDYEVVKSGKLSSLQLEAVAYACQTHETRLPDGSRAGFFIGDGAGVST